MDLGPDSNKELILNKSFDSLAGIHSTFFFFWLDILA